jgi:cytochrome c-type biogenesis protein CcmH/NrfG
VRLSACLVFEAAMLLDDAMAEARAAIVIEPTAAAPWLFLSRIQEHRGDLPAARNSARRAVDLDPGDTAAIERLRWS